MGAALIVLGIVISTVGGIMFIIAAFRESVAWGIGCLLFSPVSLFFLIAHWDEAKKPFLIHLIGIPFLITGILLVGVR